jgi:hypothetical protein
VAGPALGQVPEQVLRVGEILVLVAGALRPAGRVASNAAASSLALVLQNSSRDRDKTRVDHTASSHGGTLRKENQGREEPLDGIWAALDCASAVGEAHDVDGVEHGREENGSHVEIEAGIHKGERHRGSVGRYRFS